MTNPITQEDRDLITAIINAYHTTRLSDDYVPHILRKPMVQSALNQSRLSAKQEATREIVEALRERAEIAESGGRFTDATAYRRIAEFIEQGQHTNHRDRG